MPCTVIVLKIWWPSRYTVGRIDDGTSYSWTPEGMRRPGEEVKSVSAQPDYPLVFLPYTLFCCGDQAVTAREGVTHHLCLVVPGETIDRRHCVRFRIGMMGGCVSRPDTTINTCACSPNGSMTLAYIVFSTDVKIRGTWPTIQTAIEAPSPPKACRSNLDLEQHAGRSICGRATGEG